MWEEWKLKTYQNSPSLLKKTDLKISKYTNSEPSKHDAKQIQFWIKKRTLGNSWWNQNSIMPSWVGVYQKDSKFKASNWIPILFQLNNTIPIWEFWLKRNLETQKKWDYQERWKFWYLGGRMMKLTSCSIDSNDQDDNFQLLKANIPLTHTNYY